VTFEDPDWLAEEATLLDRVRGGDRRAFAALYRAFAGPLQTRVLLPRLGDADLAADALAETFRAFIERLDSYEARRQSIWSWLATVAINKANDVHRAEARGGRVLANYQALLEPLWSELGPPRPDQAHDQAAERIALQSAVTAVLTDIHPRYRQAIELRFLQDQPRAVCAETMAVTLGNFDVLLLRALRAFRARWQERYPQSEQA
jgi:RNA polymerase sigma factor (sigma-70 family)